MASVTLSIGDKTKASMKKFSDVNWSGFIRKKLDEKTKELEWKEEMLGKLESEKAQTRRDVQLGREVNSAITKRLRKEGFL